MYICMSAFIYNRNLLGDVALHFDEKNAPI